MNEKWIEAPRIDGNTEIAGEYNISPMTVRLIRNRAGLDAAAVREYLNGGINDLADARLMKGITEASLLLCEKARNGRKIRIIGDYDIDGVNAAYILLTALRRIGANVDTAIPDRIHDGYGLNEHLIRQACDDGVDTIVTCDNGIAASREIGLAKSLNLTVIVTDHHEIPYKEDENGVRTETLPPADATVNPKQSGCQYPFKRLCGAAVAWRLAEIIYEDEGVPREEWLELAQFAAVATVGDVMDIIGENRIIVKYGLEQLEHTKNEGYRALIEVTGLADKRISAYHIGFVIGPCINASGRLDTAKRALALLQAETRAEAEKLAGDLKALNDSRKELTEKGTTAAAEEIEGGEMKADRVLVVYMPDCHESIAGIIAGRLRERYSRPCIVLTNAEEGVKGSGRSIPEYNMFEELSRVKDLFTRFGGHPMAAGLSLAAENVRELRRRLNENCTLTSEDLTPKITYDAILPVRYAGERFIEELSLLAPFGKGNEKPVFAAGNLRVAGARVVGRNRNVLKLLLEDEDGLRVEAVRFGDADEDLAYINKRDRISILYYPDINEYQGRRSVQLTVQAMR